MKACPDLAIITLAHGTLHHLDEERIMLGFPRWIPEANWCVTKPWFDRVVGTRESMAQPTR